MRSILIIAAAMIMTASASAAVPGDDERSYLPPETSQYPMQSQARHAAPKAATHRHHKVRGGTRHQVWTKASPRHVRRAEVRQRRYRRQLAAQEHTLRRRRYERPDTHPEDILFFLPGVVFGLFE